MAKFIKDKKVKPDPREVVEDVYRFIKVLANEKCLSSDNLIDIADLTTELANRLKIQEDCGEQES